MSQDFDTQHFGDPSESGAPGHQQWLRDNVGRRWRDVQGDVWELKDDGLMHTHETRPFDFEHVQKKWGPLEPVLDGKWSVKDGLSGAVYPMPNRLIAVQVAEMHGDCVVIPGWPEDRIHVSGGRALKYPVEQTVRFVTQSTHDYSGGVGKCQICGVTRKEGTKVDCTPRRVGLTDYERGYRAAQRRAIEVVEQNLVYSVQFQILSILKPELATPVPKEEI